MREPETFDFSTFPILRTERLLLREVLPTDADDVLVFRGDPEVQKYNSDPLRNVSEVRSQIGELRVEQSTRKGLWWGVTLHGGPVVGFVGFGDWKKVHRRAEAGYELARAYWGRGIGSEAVAAIVQFGFESMHLNRIEARTIADNVESVSLLRKLGFKEEGLRREYSWEEDGTFHDSVMYGLLRREHQARGLGPIIQA